MVVIADEDVNLRQLTRRTELLEDMIGVVQTTVNQLNEFIVQATRQGVQLLPTMVRPAKQIPCPHPGGNKKQEQADESQVELTGHIPHQRRKSRSPQRHRRDVRGGNDV